MPVASVLLRAVDNGTATLYAIFGGQGISTDYFSELRQMYHNDLPLLQELLLSASKSLQILSQDPRAENMYSQGLDIMAWLRKPELTPSLDYLVTAPVSMPLLGLIQLLRFIVVCESLELAPGDFVQRLAGISGHSQGIVVAAAIATCDTWSSFKHAASMALVILFWIGCRSQQVCPADGSIPSKVSESRTNGEGTPTPMISISGLQKSMVEDSMIEVNSYLPPGEAIFVALINGPRDIVLAGPAMSLHGLAVSLRAKNTSANQGQDQGRIPFSERKESFRVRYLPVSAPFHSPYLWEAASMAVEDLKDVRLPTESLRIPVYHTCTGIDIRESTEKLVPALVRMITVDRMDWPLVTVFANATHVIDFGPGDCSGAGALTHRLKDGSGVRVLLASPKAGDSQDFGYLPEILSVLDEDLKFNVDWSSKFRPGLLKMADGETQIDTKLSRLLHLPPIMVAGMTPTTSASDFVIATMNAGYHVEVGCGGFYGKEAMTQALAKIREGVPPGRDISLNLIYANPVAMKWQMMVINDLRITGYPVSGLTIGAGVPSLEVVSSYIDTLGLKYIALKPSSVRAILKVIEIAQSHPTFPIVLQWTGGRGGGHHSNEDFHQPILQTYNAIRKWDNLILVAGSGFGDGDDTYPYMTGSWANRFGYPSMPFDGCLLGSRVMVAKEARTSKAVKEAIVSAPGVVDADWQKTYLGPAGGVITVISEMGEPIHKLATRGVLLWAELDRTIFKLEKSMRTLELKRRRVEIIARLNADFQKPWFGCNGDGVARDLDDMSYSQVVNRMIQLMYIRSKSRWIDPSYPRIIWDFVERLQERFWRSDNSSPLLTASIMNQPHEIINLILTAYPAAGEQLINAEDIEYFLHLCRRPGQKPVPFIPVLDEDFEIWFKKDSLWQSENIKAVVDEDVGRVCVLQGPVAVGRSTVVDQSIRDILDGIVMAHIQRLRREMYDGREDAIPRQDSVDDGLVLRDSLLNDQYTMSTGEEDNAITYCISLSSTSALPNMEAWLRLLAGTAHSWRSSFLLAESIVQNTVKPNLYRTIFAPRKGVQIKITHPKDASRTVIHLLEERELNQFEEALEVKLGSSNEIVVNMFALKKKSGSREALTLRYIVNPSLFAPIKEIMVGRNQSINDFYHRCWFGDKPNLRRLDGADSGNAGLALTIDAQDVKSFMRATRYNPKCGSEKNVPVSYAIKLAWNAIIGALFNKAICSNFLDLVHLSNAFEQRQEWEHLEIGHNVEVRAEIEAIVNQASGKRVSVRAIITHREETVMVIVSEFFYRGVFKDFENTIEHKLEAPRELTLASTADVAVLKSKHWLRLCDPNVALLGSRLIFRLESTLRYQNECTFSSVITVGNITEEVPSEQTRIIGTVNFSAGTCRSNEVIDYLQRLGSIIEQPVELQHPIPLKIDPTFFQTPRSNEEYAVASGDVNPIHMSRTFATYARLPDTITHGMYISSQICNMIEMWAADRQPKRVRKFTASFVGMVVPGTEVEVTVSHTAMLDGRRLFKLMGKSKVSKETVFTGEAEVELPVSAYIFTGQGSQEVGMGMELYKTSSAARNVWDQADKYCSDTYGFLITDLVRNNPKEITIYFRGQRGRMILQNYLSLTHESLDDAGIMRAHQIFPDLDAYSTSYTYRSAKGLLHATQFTQLALMLTQKASIEDMLSKGLISKQAFFAGHSLGEYSALAAIANIMSTEQMIPLVFYRGLSMQHNIERDALGRSNFGMVAVDPSRISESITIPICDHGDKQLLTVSKAFTQELLLYVIYAIVQVTGSFVEVVNFNVDGRQYVCAGDLLGLACLIDVTNTIKLRKIDVHPRSLIDNSGPTLNESLLPIVRECAAMLEAKPRPLVLERGTSTIPLPGIDIPFHSSFLFANATSFRKVLLRNISPTSINPQSLIGKYIPNVTAKPFALTKEYFEDVYQLTGSERLRDVIEKNWPK